MSKDATPGYEASSGPLTTWEFPYDRLADATPTSGEHKPAKVTGITAGNELTGTIITLDSVRSVAVLNVAPGAVYYHQVRNVATYSGEAENTFLEANVGLEVYYDNSATMPAGVYLSFSPLNNLGTANPLFGKIVWTQTEVPDPSRGDSDPYPSGSAIAGATYSDIGVMQCGIGLGGRI